MSDEKHILVVEDEADLASLVQVNLDLAGYAVTVARDGREGLARARDERPDLVLLDVMMPVLDGWQVLRAMKEDEALQDIPVVMLTALSEERDIIRGHLQGAVRYVPKPFEMRALLRAVEDGLREPDEEERAMRRTHVRGLLQRLAELDSGRSGESSVRFSRLEAPPAVRTARAEPTAADRSKLDQLTEKQRYIADQLAAGRSARDVAEELDVSRSNIYATRKRIARKLGVHPDGVAEEAQRLGLGART